MVVLDVYIVSFTEVEPAYVLQSIHRGEYNGLPQCVRKATVNLNMKHSSSLSRSLLLGLIMQHYISTDKE